MGAQVRITLFTRPRIRSAAIVLVAELNHRLEDETMGYTPLVGDYARRVVEQLDDLFCPAEMNQTERRIM